MNGSRGKGVGSRKKKTLTEQIDPQNFRYKRLKGKVRKKIQTIGAREKSGERQTEIQGDLRE